tara:strand:+ start:3605 stop:3832 length:228 start_codon:yes stop_codon:yes gene_type:complete
MDSNLANPNELEAPLVAILQKPISEMTQDELRIHGEQIRSLRAIPATRKAAKNKSSKTITANKKGVDLDLFMPKK